MNDIEIPPVQDVPSYIEFRAMPTGRKSPDGEPIFEQTYKIDGPDDQVFCLLVEAIHENPKFKEMVAGALKFEKEHDRENCPWCNPTKFGKMSNFTLKYSTRKTLIIEDDRTHGRIELSPVSIGTAKLIESLTLAVQETKPISEITAILEKLASTSFEQSAAMFFFMWITDHMECIKSGSEYVDPFARPFVINYLDSIIEQILK